MTHIHFLQNFRSDNQMATPRKPIRFAKDSLSKTNAPISQVSRNAHHPPDNNPIYCETAETRENFQTLIYTHTREVTVLYDRTARGSTQHWRDDDRRSSADRWIEARSRTDSRRGLAVVFGCLNSGKSPLESSNRGDKGRSQRGRRWCVTAAFSHVVVLIILHIQCRQ